MPVALPSTPNIIPITVAQIYAMPNASSGFTAVSPAPTTGATISVNVTASTNTIPAGVTWTAFACTNNTFPAASKIAGTIAYVGNNSANAPSNLTFTGLNGNTGYYIQLIASGFSPAAYTQASYSVITNSTYTSTANATITNVTVGTITYNGATITWSTTGIPSGTSGGSLYINSVNSSYNGGTIKVSGATISDLSTGTITTTALDTNTTYYAWIVYTGAYAASTVSAVSASSFTTLTHGSITFNAPTITYNSISFNFSWSGYTAGSYVIYNSSGTAVTTGSGTSITSTTTTAQVPNGPLAQSATYYIIITTTANAYGESTTYGNSTTTNAYATTFALGSVTFNSPTIRFNSIVFNLNWNGYNGGTYTIYDGYNNAIKTGSTGAGNINSEKILGQNAFYYIRVVTNANAYGPGGTFGGNSGNSCGTTISAGVFTWNSVSSTDGSITFYITNTMHGFAAGNLCYSNGNILVGSVSSGNGLNLYPPSGTNVPFTITDSRIASGQVLYFALYISASDNNDSNNYPSRTFNVPSTSFN